jgi:hypothetical protein
MNQVNFKTGLYDSYFINSPGSIERADGLSWNDLREEQAKRDEWFKNRIFFGITILVLFSCWIWYLNVLQ